MLMKAKQVLSMLHYRLLNSLVVGCWHRVREVPGSIPSLGPRHTADVIKMVPVVPLFCTEHSKGKILALSQELRQENKCNGQNLGQKILRSRRSLAVVVVMKKTNDHVETTKSQTLKKIITVINLFMHCLDCRERAMYVIVSLIVIVCFQLVLMPW